MTGAAEKTGSGRLRRAAGRRVRRPRPGTHADDILDQRGDVTNLREMALPAAREPRTILAERTGDEWRLNFSFSSTATYYTGQEGESGPRPDHRDVEAATPSSSASATASPPSGGRPPSGA